MSINNGHRSVSYNPPRTNSTRTVGATYGERRQLSSNFISPEPQIQRQKDFFGAKPSVQFAPNAQFLGRKPNEPLRTVERGQAHGHQRITDNARLSFLDRVIAGPAEPPAKNTLQRSVSAPSTRPTVRRS